ncbi:MAG TPA: hypothetical protein VH164_03970, partial [Ktedonobacteraceae bacterium]|nr:hypothetical protein [Ktedonobacteraceae bacterium]
MGLLTRLRTRKPYAALLVVMAAMLGLAAGGGTTAAGTAASVPGVTSNTITIGSVLDTTGPLKTICAPILAGDQLYFN